MAATATATAATTKKKQRFILHRGTWGEGRDDAGQCRGTAASEHEHNCSFNVRNLQAVRDGKITPEEAAEEHIAKNPTHQMGTRMRVWRWCLQVKDVKTGENNPLRYNAPDDPRHGMPMIVEHGRYPDLHPRAGQEASPEDTNVVESYRDLAAEFPEKFSRASQERKGEPTQAEVLALLDPEHLKVIALTVLQVPEDKLPKRREDLVEAILGVQPSRGSAAQPGGASQPARSR